MKFLMMFLMTLMLVACGNKDKSDGNSSGVSSNYLSPTTVEGYLLTNGTILINNTSYQMVTNLQQSQLNQQIQSSRVQPTMINGSYGYRARITGGLYNQCQQSNNSYGNQYGNQNCYSGSQSNLFYATAIQFI